MSLVFLQGFSCAQSRVSQPRHPWHLGWVTVVGARLYFAGRFASPPASTARCQEYLRPSCDNKTISGHCHMSLGVYNHSMLRP